MLSETQIESGNHSVKSMWLDIQTFLEKEQSLIIEAIINYPPPIPACDLQFNYLLEKRDQISQDLRQTREHAANNNETGSVEEIDLFIKTSRYLNNEQKQMLSAALKNTNVKVEN